MSVEVLVVGNEVLAGAVADTNSGAVARALAALGHEVARVTQVGDVPEAIAQAAAEAVQRARVLVVSGGLGPTPDDCTKEALAAHFGSRLELDAETLDDIRRRFAERGLVMPESNRKQALLPQGARKIPNPVGSAPGVHWRLAGCDVFLLPGVPDELCAMLDSYVLPELRRLGGRTPARRAVFRTVGLPESEIAQRLQPTMAAYAAWRWGFYPGRQGLDVQVVDASSNASASEFDVACAAVREALGDIVYTEEEGVPLEEIVRRLCVEKGHTLAVAESCTGGLLGGWLTAAPGSSAYFIGGFVTYADATKRDWLGVPEEMLAQHGAVSAEVAIALARSARARAGATLGLAITGVAGPGGGTADKPVGLVFLALSAPDGEWSLRLQLGRRREANRAYSCLLALDLLRRYEIGLPLGA
ncbi:MAG TPA: CinA family nicotinamide mononucleotide deamidase-related protein [Candidatus Krumholzibacteria bacterium]|nr:CinA family nicotinamide mononucleotide deamidase-related protein [Candidatus Krumholzibacteria bacterium]